jgi:hypothetical protein
LGTKPIESFKNAIENYAEVAKAAAFVRDQSRPGPVMVFETPLIDNLSGREQATPLHDFIWHWVPRHQHEKSVAILNATPPPSCLSAADTKNSYGSERQRSWICWRRNTASLGRARSGAGMSWPTRRTRRVSMIQAAGLKAGSRILPGDATSQRSGFVTRGTQLGRSPGGIACGRPVSK